MVSCAPRVRARAQRGLSTDDLATLKRISDQILENLAAEDPLPEPRLDQETVGGPVETPAEPRGDPPRPRWNPLDLPNAISTLEAPLVPEQIGVEA